MTIQYLGKRGQVVGRARPSGAASRFGFTLEVDPVEIERVKTKYQKASGMSLYKQMQRANLAAGDMLAKRMQQASPRDTGNLRKSIAARLERRGSSMTTRLVSSFLRIPGTGATTTVLVGPKAPHRHLVILGTGWRSVTRPGRKSSPFRVLPGGYTSSGQLMHGLNVLRREAIPNTGRMTPNPFVKRAASGFGPTAARIVAQHWRTLYR